jgi:hypothetical protein
MHYFLRSLGGVGRVQEGKKPAERATIARVAAANGGYVGTAASCRGPARYTVTDTVCRRCDMFDHHRLLRAPYVT